MKTRYLVPAVLTSATLTVFGVPSLAAATASEPTPSTEQEAEDRASEEESDHTHDTEQEAEDHANEESSEPTPSEEESDHNHATEQEAEDHANEQSSEPTPSTEEEAEREAEEGDAFISVSPGELTTEEFLENGVLLTGEGLEPNTEYTINAGGAEGIEELTYTVTSSAEGSIEQVIKPDNPEGSHGGGYVVTVTDQNGEQVGEEREFFTTVDGDDPMQGELTLSTDELTNSEYVEDGVGASVTGLEPNTDYEFTRSQDGASREIIEFTTDANGNGEARLTVSDTADHSGQTITVGVQTAKVEESTPREVAPSQSFKVLADDGGSAEGELTIDPSIISLDKFLDENEGVTVTASGLEPGEGVTLHTTHANDDSVRPIEYVGEADEEGNATFVVYGSTAETHPDSVPGPYDVTLVADSGTELTGQFEVAENGGEDGGQVGGSGEAGDAAPAGGASGGGNLPQTGAELAGLAAGAGLLALGVGTVLVTRRKAKQQDIGEA